MYINSLCKGGQQGGTIKGNTSAATLNLGLTLLTTLAQCLSI